ncbi:MAG: hypothetical protein JNM32_13590 [Dechloromonas sp.]|jgi:hypothetical protein|nr:hypothetical protein [Dechloromonas sp.]
MADSQDDPSPEELDLATEQALIAALGGLSPREALLEASRAQDADAEARQAARERNRANALRLLEILEKSGGGTSD